MSAQIAVVEDERELLGMLRHALEQEGYDVTSFDHADPVSLAESPSQPALFLIDLMLPGLDGIEFAGRLRLHGFASSPMIAMSASSSELRRAARSHLFDEILSKPFDLAELVRCVRRYTA